MKYDFYIDIDQLETLETEYKNRIDELTDIYTAICEKMDELPNAWQGESFDTFSELYEEWKYDFLCAITAAIAYDKCLIAMGSMAVELVEARDKMASEINKL